METYNLKEVIRDIQINSVMKKMILTPDIKKIKKGDNIFFNKPYWKIIEKYKDDCIITGSMALFAFGLIKRIPKDIDLIVFTPEIKLPKLYKSSYPEENHVNLIGTHEDSGYIVDFFEEENPIYIECDGYKFEHPLQIILKKSKMSRNVSGYVSKDINDILECYKNIKYED
jgi:hypothetical protein